MNIRKHCRCGEQEGMEGNVRYKGKCIFLHPHIAGSKRGEIGGLSLSIVQFFLTSYIVAQHNDLTKEANDWKPTTLPINTCTSALLQANAVIIGLQMG
jgi:hypothetical protein